MIYLILYITLFNIINMNITKLWIWAIKFVWKIIWQEDKVNEWLLNGFIDSISDLKWDILINSIRNFLNLDLLNQEDKKNCLDYLFQNWYIDLENVDEIKKLFPEFKDLINKREAFLNIWDIWLTQIWVWNEVTNILK